MSKVKENSVKKKKKLKQAKEVIELKEDDFWPDDIRNLFGYDNETIFACKIKEYQQLLKILDQLVPKTHLLFLV